MRAVLLTFALSTALFAVGVHVAVVNALPGFIMSRAIGGFEAAGLGWNTWATAPRITPRTQTVVRSSPDLAYAVCLLDLSNGPVRLSAPRWPGYGSVSVFDDTSSNLFVSGLQGDGGEVTIIVAQEGTAVEGDAPVVRLPGARGIALIRRLAPDADSHAEATALVDQSECRAA